MTQTMTQIRTNAWQRAHDIMAYAVRHANANAKNGSTTIQEFLDIEVEKAFRRVGAIEAYAMRETMRG